MTTDIPETPSPQSQGDPRNSPSASNTDQAPPESKENVPVPHEDDQILREEDPAPHENDPVPHEDEPIRASGIIMAQNVLREPERPAPIEVPERRECEPVPARPGPDAALEDALVPNRPVNAERRLVRRMMLYRNRRGTPCREGYGVYVQEPRFSDIVMIQSGFELLLELTGYGILLARDMKKSEVAVGDLSRQVKYSDLAFKYTLVNALDSFATTAKTASRHLISWDASVVEAVDLFLVMEEDTIRTLEYLEQDERTKSFFHSSPPQEQIRAQLIEKFNELARSLKQSLTNLKDVSVATAALLRDAESDLAKIHEVVVKEEGYANEKRNELLTDIWAWTRPKTQEVALSEIEDEKNLLSKVEGVRTTAADQVSKSTGQLDQMEMAIDSLRNRFATPVLLRNTSIPLRHHIDTLKAGFNKLEDSRLKAKARKHQVIDTIAYGPRYTEIS